jgi:hypothetical protein
LDSLFADPSRIWHPEEVIQKFVGPPYFPPGKGAGYSNTNYLLAQMIVEKITGHTYQTELRNRILQPLALNHTYFFPFEKPTNDTIAHAWSINFGKDSLQDLMETGFPLDGLFSLAGAAGAILSTTEDLSRFMGKLMSGKIISSASLAEMQDTVPGTGYGLGIQYFPFSCSPGWGHGGRIIYQSACVTFDKGNFTLAIQTSDDSNMADIGELFKPFINSYCDYKATGIEEYSSDASLIICPNPSAGIFNVTATYLEEGTIEVFDMMGTCIEKIKLKNDISNYQLDLSRCSEGIYLVNVISQGKKTTKKIIVQK